MKYIDCGINWLFPYEVIESTDTYVILKELPRVHKSEAHTITGEFCYPQFNQSTIIVDGKTKDYIVLPKD